MRRELTAISPTGEKLSTFFSIGVPQRQSEVQWKCEVWIGELLTEPRDVYGVDSWHAMQLAMYSIYRELKLRTRFGWSFSWFDGEESDLETILSNKL